MAALALPTLALAAAPSTMVDRALTLQADSSALGWTLVQNSNMPEGRGVPGLCTGPWGFMVFGGETLETENTDETWLLSRPGGTWEELHYTVKPSARALPAVAPYRDGCLLFGGVFHNGQTTTFGDTWYWTMTNGWTELTESVGPGPSPRFYHTLKDMSNGDLVLFGGRTGLVGTEASSVGETWIYNGTWNLLSFRSNMNIPFRRWGHAMTCGLRHTGSPNVTSSELPNGHIECLMFAGAQQGDDDFFDDTWLLRYVVDANGEATEPRTYFWEQLNDETRPHGRWCFAMATCGSRVLMIGGSTDFRLAADETWVWEPSIRQVESRASSGRTGQWRRLYGSSPFWDMNPRPSGAGPLRISAYSIANQNTLGASDIFLFGGVNNQSGGLFIHKGWETSEMWRFPCNEGAWPEALIASPPTPPAPPPPPNLPPGDYNGGTTGYMPVLRPPRATTPPPGSDTSASHTNANNGLSINDVLHLQTRGKQADLKTVQLAAQPMAGQPSEPKQAELEIDRPY